MRNFQRRSDGRFGMVAGGVPATALSHSLQVSNNRQGVGGWGHSDVNSKSTHAKIIGIYSILDVFAWVRHVHYPLLFRLLTAHP